MDEMNVLCWVLYVLIAFVVLGIIVDQWFKRHKRIRKSRQFTMKYPFPVEKGQIIPIGQGISSDPGIPNKYQQVKVIEVLGNKQILVEKIFPKRKK